MRRSSASIVANPVLVGAVTALVVVVAVFLDRPCANYTNAQMVKDGTAPERCRAWLGPNQPGVTSPDFTASGGEGGGARRRAAGDGDGRSDRRSSGGAGDGDGNGGGSSGSGSGGGNGGGGNGPAGLSPVPNLSGLLDEKLPEAPQVPDVPQVPELGRDEGIPSETEDLLDFLVGSG